MICGTCGIFQGVPVCGCCRALTRIQVIVTEGHLKASQESEVLRLLRDTVGGLQDLVESNRSGGSSPRPAKRVRRPEGEEAAESKAHPPQDSGGKEKKKHPREDEKEELEEVVVEPEEGSYTSYETRESPPAEERVPLPPARGSLGRELQLKATGKASANPKGRPSAEEAEGRDRRSPHRHRQDDEKDYRPELPRSTKGAVKPREPEYPPPRRDQAPGERHRHRKKKKESKSKGKQKRERGRIWRNQHYQR